MVGDGCQRWNWAVIFRVSGNREISGDCLLARFDCFADTCLLRYGAVKMIVSFEKFGRAVAKFWPWAVYGGYNLPRFDSLLVRPWLVRIA